MDHLFDRLRRLVRELRRRRVFRVAVVYAGTAFIILQVCAVTFPALRLPEWTMTLVVVLLLVGAPIALIGAWAFEITPDGVVRTSRREDAAADRPADGGKPFTGDAAILTMLLVIAGLLAYPYIWQSRYMAIQAGRRSGAERGASCRLTQRAPPAGCPFYCGAALHLPGG